MNARLFPAVPAALSALLCAGAAAAQTPVSPTMTGTRLDVAVEGAVTRIPDLATINAGVVTDAPTGTAMRENARRMAATLAALKGAGIADRDIQTSAIALNPQYRYDEGKPPVITGYQASNQVNIRFRDIANAGKILDTLVAQGANQINGPAFSVDKSEAALDEARAEAVDTARRRAELYAKAAGLRVKRIVSITESSASAPPPYPVLQSMAREKATTDIQPGEQELKINLSVTFELE